MPEPVPTPRSPRYFTAAAFDIRATDRDSAADVLGLDALQLGPTPGGAFEATLDVPPGIWRVWLRPRTAIWVSRVAGRTAPPISLIPLSLDLLEAASSIARAGFALQELRVLRAGTWSGLIAPTAARAALTDPEAEALWSVWASAGRAVPVEAYRRGIVWSATSELADRLLTIICHEHA